MDELSHQEDALLEELTAQLEEGHPVEFWIEDMAPDTSTAGPQRAYLTDVKFEDGVTKVRVSPNA